jgi:serine/threonine protein kinase
LSRSQQFGRYELLDRVNVGGMAEIFRAVDTQSGALCAVKRILPEIADDEEFIRMFRDEAKIVGQLEHPNICRILDLGKVNSDWFLAMQYVEGLDLRSIFDRAIKNGERLELPFVLHVFMKVCEGLEYAHRKRDTQGRPLNVVHRDVSPQNILVAFDGDVKLIDFGIAKSNGKLSKTQVGTIKGKYGYMSPEQVRGLPLDHRSDIFSLGICMYELLTRRRLFASDNEMLIMERIKEAEVSSLRTIDPVIPVTVDQIVLRALARDVAERYASAADLYADLQAFAYSEGLVWSKDAVAEYMQRTFAGGAAKPTTSNGGINGQNLQPRVPPSADPRNPLNKVSTATPPADAVRENLMSENKGSDLDVFEGLTSKRGGPVSRAPSSAAPPPPPTRSVPPPPPPTQRRAATQMGLGLPPMPGMPGAPRTSTPPIAPPPSRSSSAGAPPPPPPASMRGAPPPPAPPPPSAQARGAMVDMDWDDEDEKTHVYDKDVVSNAFAAMSPGPAAGRPPPPPAPLPPPSMPGGGQPKATMMGIQPALPPPSVQSNRAVPPPPPSRRSAPVPPPPAPPSSPNPLAATMVNTGQPMHAPQHGQMGGQMGGPMMGPPMTAPMPPPPAPMQQPAQAAYAPAPPRPADATQVIRPKSSSNVGLIIGALVLAAGAGVGAFFWMSSRPGNVLVNVEVKGPKGTKVSVSIDGAEKCQDSSCRIEGVSPGAHVVKATAGDVEKKATINVEPGKDAIANLALEVASKKTGVKLASSQTGLKVEIDGGSPRALPVEDDSLKPGSHTLKFTGPGGRYGIKEMKISLEEGQIKTLDEVKLPLKSVKTKFVFLTKGTKATLDDGTKKVDLKDDGQPIELDTSKSYTVTANATGHEELKKTIEFGDEPEQAVKLELQEKGKAAPVPAPTPAPAPTPGPIAVAPKPTPTPVAPAPTPTPAAAANEGSLFVNTLPASACVVDGTPRGKTPFTIKLSPGSHSITCVAKDGEETLKKSASANVNAGETAKVILKLRD